MRSPIKRQQAINPPACNVIPFVPLRRGNVLGGFCKVIGGLAYQAARVDCPPLKGDSERSEPGDELDMHTTHNSIASGTCLPSIPRIHPFTHLHKNNPVQMILTGSG